MPYMCFSSMIIRDLTLRSAASFGSFHLIRLLYDEYIFYLVEQKVAAATGQTTIAVMGEVSTPTNVYSLQPPCDLYGFCMLSSVLSFMRLKVVALCWRYADGYVNFYFILISYCAIRLLLYCNMSEWQKNCS